MSDDGSLNYRYEARRASSFTSTSGTSFHEVRLASHTKHEVHFALRHFASTKCTLHFVTSRLASRLASSKLRLASRLSAPLRVSSLCRCDRNRHGLTCTILLKKLNFLPATFAFEQGGKRQLSGNYCQKPFLRALFKGGRYPRVS